MTETIHKTLWKLFNDIRAHRKETGAEIEPHSDQKRLLIGWKCDDDYHYVRLSTLKTRTALVLPVENDDVYQLIVRLIVSAEGRHQIAAVLNCNSDSTLECFERMLRLKAFW